MRKHIMLIIVTISLMISGCSDFGSGVSMVEGSIEGTYTLDVFDSNGGLLLKTHGKNITVKPNTIVQYSYSSEGWSESEELSNVLSVTIGQVPRLNRHGDFRRGLE